MKLLSLLLLLLCPLTITAMEKYPQNVSLEATIKYIKRDLIIRTVNQEYTYNEQHKEYKVAGGINAGSSQTSLNLSLYGVAVDKGIISYACTLPQEDISSQTEQPSSNSISKLFSKFFGTQATPQPQTAPANNYTWTAPLSADKFALPFNTPYIFPIHNDYHLTITVRTDKKVNL